MPGVVWAVLRLRTYLEPTRFTIRTDHRALKRALLLAKAEGRLAKWRLRLAEFGFDVLYRPSVKHSVTDALCRVETTNGDQDALEDEIPASTSRTLGLTAGTSSTGDWIASPPPCNPVFAVYLTSAWNPSFPMNGFGNRRMTLFEELPPAR